MTQEQLNQIATLQNKYSPTIVLARFDEHYFSINKAAQIVADTLGVELNQDPELFILYTRISIALATEGLSKLVRAGHKVAIADPEIQDKPRRRKKSNTRNRIYLKRPLPQLIEELRTDAFYLSHQYFTEEGWYTLIGETADCYIIENKEHRISLFKTRFKPPTT